MNFKSLILLSAISLFSLGQLAAQSARMEPFPDRTSLPHQRKADQMKRMDVFVDHKFNPFFSIDGQIGLIGTFSKDLTRALTPPLAISVNYRLTPTFSLGVQGSISRYAAEINYYDRSYTTAVHTSNRMLQMRFNAHIPVGARGEAYGGLGVGYRGTDVAAQEGPAEEKADAESIVRPQNGFLTTAHIGARYSLTPQLGIMGEVGSGLSLMTIGVSYRLR
ncbi:MAG: hypothetical protein AAF544_07050 [Bacteroidota bacterium]